MEPSTLTVFPLLAEPDRYVATEWDLLDADRRSYWLDLFRNHFPTLLEEAVRDAVDHGEPEAAARERASGAKTDFDAFLDAVAEDPFRFERPDVMTLCLAREASLRRFGFDDAYRSVKARENERALRIFPDVVRELDALDEPERRVRIVEGIFAGNVFDLGATKTAALFQDGRAADFFATRSELRPRPWCVDDLDPWLARLSGPAHRAAVLFVDNAGPDLLLGLLPFARELLRRGTEVILTANSEPALNDVTHAELIVLLERVRRLDPVLDAALGRVALEAVASGNGAPLIDLTRVSAELARAVVRRGVDLVVLEGMGRAVESNYSAALSCDTVKVAMLKDPDVAAFAGGAVYDLVFRFEPGRPE